jgi:hypothetical protein
LADCGGVGKREATWRILRLTSLFSLPTGQIESNYDEVTDSFDSMDLKPELLRGM